MRHVDPIEYPFPPRATPRVARREHRPWSAHLATFLAAIAGDRCEALCVLALGTGLRQSELLGLRWADVTQQAVVVRGKLDEHSRTISATKTAQSRRRVDVPAAVAPALGAHRVRVLAEQRATSADAFVVVNTAGGPTVASNLRRAGARFAPGSTCRRSAFTTCATRTQRRSRSQVCIPSRSRPREHTPNARHVLARDAEHECAFVGRFGKGICKCA